MTRQTLFSISAGANVLPADVSVIWGDVTLLTGVRIEPGESLVLELVPSRVSTRWSLPALILKFFSSRRIVAANGPR